MIITIHNIFMKHVRSLWDIRNSMAHDADPQNHMGYRRLTLLTQVQDLYQKYDQVLACDKHLLDEPVEDFQRKSNSQIKTFLDYTKPLINFSIKTVKEQGTTQFTPINIHFKPRNRIPDHLLELLQ